MGKKKTIWLAFWILVLYITMAAYGAKIMIGMSVVFEEFDVPSFLNRGAILFYGVVLFLLFLYHKYDNSVFGFGLFQALLFFTFLDFTSGILNERPLQENLFKDGILVLSILTYILAYNLYLMYPREGLILQLSAIIVVIALCAEYLVLSNGLRITFNHSSLHLGIVYIPLIFAPLLLLNNNKFSWLCIILILYVLFDSGKRGGLFDTIGGLLLYYHNIRGTIKMSKKLLAGLIFVLVILFAGGVVIEYMTDSTMIEQIVHGTDSSDYSSGRIDIMKDVLYKYWNSDAVGIFFGHGLGSVAEFSKEKVSAHNDFVEILFDFGIFGLISLLLFFLCFAKQVRRIPKRENKLKGTYMYALVVALLMATVSHIFIYQYLCLFTFTWGALSGTYKQIQINQRKND